MPLPRGLPRQYLNAGAIFSIAPPSAPNMMPNRHKTTERRTPRPSWPRIPTSVQLLPGSRHRKGSFHPEPHRHLDFHNNHRGSAQQLDLLRGRRQRLHEMPGGQHSAIHDGTTAFLVHRVKMDALQDLRSRHVPTRALATAPACVGLLPQKPLLAADSYPHPLSVSAPIPRGPVERILW